MGRHRGRGPYLPSRRHVPIFGISSWAGLAFTQITEQISGVGEGEWGSPQRDRERDRIVAGVFMREKREERSEK